MADEGNPLNGGESKRVDLEVALAAWAADPVLAAPLADSARAFLVLDGMAMRVLHASPAAVSLRDAVSNDDGVLDPGLAGQIRTVGGSQKPRLVRLRLDPRRIAPPTACLIAAGALDGAEILLLVATGPLPAFRPRPARVEAGRPDRDAVPAEPAGSDAPAPGARFVWRSDAGDRLTTIAGPSFESLAPLLIGRSWTELEAAGRLRDADAFLAAVRGRSTFRALQATLEVGSVGALALDVSGACLGRGGEAFSGFGGYGVVRAVTAPTGEPKVEAPSPGPSAMEATPPSADPAPAYEADLSEEVAALPALRDRSALPDIRQAAWSPAFVTAARFGDAWTGAGDPAASEDSSGDAAEETTAIPVESEPVASESAAPPERPSAVREGPDTEVALSVTEHAAFREIARALGARYAGDEAVEDMVGEAGASRTGSGAVMPFPVPKAVELEGRPPTESPMPPLDDLPVAMLIHRGDTVLAANRRLLELTGYDDLVSLQAAGLGQLFQGLPPDVHEADAAGGDGLRVVETARGGSRLVAIERGPTTWAGSPASCLILRAAAEADPAREQAAERLAQSFRDRHAADARATLDALEDGVVTLDADFRILAMNRAAADLFACDPREVVGTGFEALFESSQRDAVRASVAGLGTETQTASAAGRPLLLRVSGRDGTRVAVLRAPAKSGVQPTPGFDRPAFLGRLDREIRTPAEEIVGLADGVLAESHGPIDERDRATLRAIRTAGDHVRGLAADLIALANIESGGLAMAVGPLPLNDMVSGCVESLQPEAARGRIVLRTSFSPDLAPMEADEPSLRQAALTVIGDAIRATAAGGQVIVSTAPGERGGVALKVRGTGPGVRPGEGEGTADRREAGEARGTGLGLPLSKALVEANHGCLHVSNRGNEGTLVEILLPGRAARTA